MGNNSKIPWTDHTFNPWRGCTKVSAGCANCYAENMGRRFGVAWGPGADRIPASEAMWKQPLAWDRAAARDGARRRVFCSSMADVFDDHPSILPEWRERLWELIRNTPNLDWLLLTKRPENFRQFLPDDWGKPGWRTEERDFGAYAAFHNVWLGVSVEDQKAADDRVGELILTPAKIHFLSCEPLLESVVIYRRHLREIDWVICGGETGPGARLFDPIWARWLIGQMKEHTAHPPTFFFKSTGGRNREKSNLLDGRTWQEFPR